MSQASGIGKRQRTVIALAFALALPVAVQAQYKVVGPDGKVTYTDRAPVKAAGKAQQIDTTNASGATTPNASLPLELRQVATRYPVTLYNTKSCEGCEAARQFLRQRGIPYAEKVVGEADAEALQRATGSRQVPALTIGGQVLRGFSADQWASYLTAAGYPRESRLPLNYAAPAPEPLVARAAPVASSAPAPQQAAELPAPPPAPGGIRF